MKEFSEKLSGVKEDLKVRTKQTAETIYKSVDDVLTEAEATSKKVTANVKEKMSAATEEVKESFRLGKEDTSSCKDGSPETSKHEYSETSSHSDDKSQAGTSGYTLFNKLRKKRNHARHASAGTVEKSTRTELVIVPTKKSVLGEKWEAFKNKMRGHPAYKRVNEYTKPVVNIGQEVAEDVRERWETSDNPVVQKIQDLNESIFEETATAVSFREIRQRDPSFSLPDFAGDVQEMIKPVLTAYSKGDVKTLKKYCTKEVIERCKGERDAYASQGIFFDHKILHISDADVRETKMMGSTPIIIVGFQTQQIYCVRDREGQVTEGGQDTIQTVFYAWAMQLMDSDEVPEEESYYPVWRLREIQQVVS
uniref:Tim44-like domain-containing protein n=1 Tax=Oryza nivara TaxID=4536 RepID=A0A0E0FYX5_ORYNI